MKADEKFAIIADDYTGAGDSGIHFSRLGRKIELLLNENDLGEQLKRYDGVSLTTESRFLPSDEAARRVTSVVKQCQSEGFTSFFKKIDSTLRGNPGSEVEACLEASGLSAALICTAMPSTNRSCVFGKIYIGGTLLHETEIGRDPFNPMSSSSVVEIFSQQTDLAIGQIKLEQIENGSEALAADIQDMLDDGVRLFVGDGVSEKHLATLARQIDRFSFLPVGAGGFAKAYAAVSAKSNTPSSDKDMAEQKGPVLAVIGSLSDTTRKQAELACASGYFDLFEFTPGDTIETLKNSFDVFYHSRGERLPNILMRAELSETPLQVSKEDGEKMAAMMGELAAYICRKSRCRAIFSTGGSTSMGVARAIGVAGVTLVDEIMPGVVLGSCTVPGTAVEWFISKAGGFGGEEILKQIALKFS